MERKACMECIPIGVVRSPYRERGDAPRQGRLVDTAAEIHIFEEFSPACRTWRGAAT